MMTITSPPKKRNVEPFPSQKGCKQKGRKYEHRFNNDVIVHTPAQLIYRTLTSGGRTAEEASASAGWSSGTPKDGRADVIHRASPANRREKKM